MYRVSRWFVSAVVLLVFPTFVFAEEKQPDAPVYLHDYKPVPAQERQPEAPVYVHDYKPEARTSLPQNTPYLSLRLNAGTFDRNNNSELSHEGGGPAFGLEVGIMPEEVISYRLELMTVSTRYDTNIPPPAWGMIDSRMTLDTNALLFGVRASYPPRRPYRFHATAGIGYFNSKLTATGSTFGFPGEVSDDDSSLGFHAGAGFEVNLGNWVVGVDFRRWFVGTTSFPTFNVTSADIGGDYLGFSVGRVFK